MKVLITGGAGFIGSHVVEILLSKGYEVIVIDLLSSGAIGNIPKEKLVFYQMDVTSPKLDDVFQHERPDAVIHLAAQVSVSTSLLDPVYDGNVNITGTLFLLQLCVRYNIKKFIFASSAATYGIPAVLPIDEKHSLQPTSFYGLSKMAGELYIKMYHELFHLDYCILRYSNVYGPRQNIEGEAGVIAIFLNRILQNEPLIIYGDGNQTRDFVYVKDVANACSLALEDNKSDLFNISSETEVSINQLVILLRKISRAHLHIRHIKERKGEITNSCLSNHHANKQLNWQPSFSLQQGLTETYNYFGMMLEEDTATRQK